MTTGPDHYRRAEELAQEAYKRLGQEDKQSAAAWAALAQVHATLASVAATMAPRLAMGYEEGERAWRDAIGVPRPSEALASRRPSAHRIPSASSYPVEPEAGQ